MNAEVYHNLLDLVTKPKTTATDFKKDVLKFLNDNLRSEHFWFFTYSDEKNRMIDPVVLNVNEHSLKEYLGYYQNFCTFNPNKNPSLLHSNKNVFTVTDVMPLREFEETAFYQDHLRRDNYYYTALAFLKFEGSLLGTISVTNPKERDIVNRDLNILSSISPYIANRFSDYTGSDKLHTKQQLFNSIVQEEQNGLIILSDKYTVIKHNDIAEELCGDILNKSVNTYSPLHKVITDLIPKIKKNGFFSTSLNVDRKSYNLLIAPSSVISLKKGIETYYLVFISRSESLKNISLLKSSEFRLTARELEIIELMSKGKTSKEIAESLTISVYTVRKHIDNVYKKVGEKNKVAVLQKLRTP